MKFKEWLQVNGWDPNLQSEAQLSKLRLAYKAERRKESIDASNDMTQARQPKQQQSQPMPVQQQTQAAAASAAVTSVDAVVHAAENEANRQQAITEMVAKTISGNPSNRYLREQAANIGRLAIEAKWDTQRAELELLRVSRDINPNISVIAPSRPVLDDKVLEAAVCRHARLERLEQYYTPNVLEASEQHFRHGIGLQELLHTCAQRSGWRGHSVRSDLSGALRAAFMNPYDGMRAEVVGPSTYSISGILSNIANKFLRVGFDSVESEWRKITSIRSVNDFKTITSYTLTGDNTYEKIAPGGEIKHGSLGEETYTNRADSYGKLLGIDRRDWINDDLGALTGAGRRLGRGGALKLNEVFWTEFLADASTFWTVARGNYDDGATDTVVTLAGVSNIDALFRAQTDPDGKPLGIMPKIMLVPTALRLAAIQFMSSTLLNLATSTTATSGQSNPLAGAYEVVSSVYLSNSAMGGGYSALAWYLLADPNELPVIETAFLNGVEMPTIETTDLDFNRLGTAMRGYHDFGVNKQEYRGGVKAKGEA